jgi:hypothetical protein
MVRTIQVTYGKMTKDGKKRNRDKAPTDGIPFKKHSIFYKYLPYWADFQIHHAMDGMHLKKNAFGNTIGLLLETSPKIKDTLKSRQDLVAMKIREDLHPVDKGNGRYELPLASYNLTHDEKKAMCESLLSDPGTRNCAHGVLFLGYRMGYGPRPTSVVTTRSVVGLLIQ